MTRSSIRTCCQTRWTIAALLTSTAALAGTSLITPSRRAQEPSPRPAAKTKQEPARGPLPAGSFLFSKAWEKTYDLQAGKTVEVSVRLETPSALPANGRVAVEWAYVGKSPSSAARQPRGSVSMQDPTLNIAPSASWRKVLHALDGDVNLLYRAPIAGQYRLRLAPVSDEPWVGDAQSRWREKGSAPKMAELPARTPWPTGFSTPVSAVVSPVNLGSRADQERLRSIIECEPNDTAETAQPIAVTSGPDVETWEVTGGADDIEYFDNGQVGKSGEDWFRIEFKGSEPRLLTAQISMPGQAVAARVRAYKATGSASDQPAANSNPSGTNPISDDRSSKLPVVEFKDGQDGNERVHQQDEEHRTQVHRLLKPGETYYLRVEANSPGYQLQLRTVRPAPYDDPRMAIRQGMYTQIGQVDAWLTNRPRGASVERRIRDSGNLMGTNCMSCHTQSGVWGPSVPIAQGYPVENVQNYWHLINVMYECLRPTNELKDAANNTSLAPLDIGDGPAGTRAAGFNIVNAERILAPRKLHSKMQVRTANYVLLTADPGGINAAGPGSNIGFVIVNTFSTEILKTAWEKTGDPKYFRGLEKKAKQVLEVDPKFTDDVALRLDYFGRVAPIKTFAAWAEKAKMQEVQKGQKAGAGAEEIAPFVEKVVAQLREDEARLRSIQNPDGSWSFNPGTSPDGGKTWKSAGDPSDPAPTALGIMGLTSAGYGKDDPNIARGVKALLASQDPSGRWNKAAQTGFVTSAYALHALARLYPIPPSSPVKGGNAAKDRTADSLPAIINSVRTAALGARKEALPTLIAAAGSSSAVVRYWAQIGLGATHTTKGVTAIMPALRDRSKMVREAATWALKQTLLDDKGWPDALAAARSGDDYTREHVWQALNMRADAVMPAASVRWAQLNALWEHGMNRDPHPGVRAWSAKAAWQWWVWNPPVRTAINAAWIRLLERPEPSALVENSNRYSTQALFIVNGHKANGSKEHQYKELAALFETLDGRLEEADPAIRGRLARRLVAVGGTFFQTAGGDGGPGQMGYITPFSGDMMGNAALTLLKGAAEKNDLGLLRPTLEGAAGVPNRPLTEWLVNYSLKGPEDLRQLAAGAISDPRIVTLAAVPEQIEQQLAQVRRGAMEPPRRAQVSDPIIDLWSKVNWSVPTTEEQQRAFFDLLIPKFDTYRSISELASITDAAQRTQAEREMAAAWYLADRLGQVIEQNPDLHLEIVLFRYFPAKMSNPLEAHFWLHNVGWLLTFKGAAEKMGRAFDGAAVGTPRSALRNRAVFVSLQSGAGDPQRTAPTAPDPLLTIKDRALQLYLDMLKPTSDAKTRSLAIRMANQTALRTNPEVLRTLTEILPTLKDDRLKEVVGNVLKQSGEKFMPDLSAALTAERHASVPFNEKGEPQLAPSQLEDILYFRDYVMPEMARQKRQDQQSCIGCHGKPGRVPSYEMKSPDEFGYIAVADLLKNYRTTQSKINLKELERSKMLRKPLNIQDGQEDGHQGGRRYGPTDEGYQVLKKWVERQPEVQKQPEGTRSNRASVSLRRRHPLLRPWGKMAVRLSAPIYV